jgi:hypothetical protein
MILYDHDLTNMNEINEKCSGCKTSFSCLIGVYSGGESCPCQECILKSICTGGCIERHNWAKTWTDYLELNY